MSRTFVLYVVDSTQFAVGRRILIGDPNPNRLWRWWQWLTKKNMRVSKIISKTEMLIERCR